MTYFTDITGLIGVELRPLFLVSPKSTPLEARTHALLFDSLSSARSVSRSGQGLGRMKLRRTNSGIEVPLPGLLPDRCFRLDVAVRRFGVSADELKKYTHEGLVLSLKSSRGVLYYTDRDCGWIHTIRRLRKEAGLSFDDIRRLVVSRCACWTIRHCGFQSKEECPVIADPSKPCWVNRAKWSMLVSCPCYSCSVYRSAPECEALRGVLVTLASGTPPTDGYSRD